MGKWPLATTLVETKGFGTLWGEINLEVPFAPPPRREIWGK